LILGKISLLKVLQSTQGSGGVTVPAGI